MAEQLGDGLRAALASEDRDRVFARFLGVFRELGSGSVLVFEDLHWADSATLDLLRVVGRRLTDTPVLIIGTARGHDLDGEHPLRLALGEIPPHLVTELPVPPLSIAAVGTLVAGTEIDPRDLHGATGGNPFFVTEVIAAGRGDVPPTIRAAVGSRVARLSPAARSVLHAAAVLGAVELAWLRWWPTSSASWPRWCLARNARRTTVRCSSVTNSPSLSARLDPDRATRISTSVR
jgi:predicted ATPase